MQTVARVPGPVPTAGMGPQPPATALVGKHGNATYLNNQQQAAVLQQQQQHMQLMEKQKQLFIGQRQQLMAEQVRILFFFFCSQYHNLRVQCNQFTHYP